VIKTVEIKNFQSHQLSELELSEGLNVIVGSSEVGKSSIIRALLWVIRNRPQGFGFRSWFAPKGDSTRVALEFSDGNWVVRERDMESNRYLTTFHTDEDPLEAVRTDVPKEVSEIINIADYNIQTQHERFFLLQNTAGEVARMFNNIVGLDSIDKSLSSVASIIRSSCSKRDDAKEKVERLEEELREFEFLEELEDLVAKLEKLLGERDLKRQERSELTQIYLSITKLDEEIEEADKRLELERESRDFFREVGLLDSDVRLKDWVDKVIEELERLSEDIRALDTQISPEGDLEDLTSEIQDYKRVVKDRAEMEYLVDMITKLDAGIVHVGEKIEEYEKGYQYLFKQAKVCPVCLTPISRDVLKRISGTLA
jgi:exonuclease SbcC